MQKKAKRVYTVLFIPEDHGKTFSIRIHRSIVKYLIVSIVIILVGLVVLVINTGIIGVKLQLLQTLKVENKRYKDENAKLMAIQDKLTEIELLKRYLTTIISKSYGTESNLVLHAGGGTASEKLLSPDETGEVLNMQGMYESYSDRDGRAYLKGVRPGIMPAQGWITRYFNADSYDHNALHNGIDIAATEGTLIRSSWSGEVKDSYQDAFLGLTVEVFHNNGYVTRYGHCSQVLVSRGEWVECGQAIALVGNTGRSSGPHVHFEVISNGKNIDPLKVIYANVLTSE